METYGNLGKPIGPIGNTRNTHFFGWLVVYEILDHITWLSRDFEQTNPYEPATIWAMLHGSTLSKPPEVLR